MDANLAIEVRRIVTDLAAGRYEEIVADGRAGAWSTNDLRIALREYGRTLVPLPDEAMALVQIYPHRESADISLDVPLWTAEEGRSDLTLLLDASSQHGQYKVQVTDLHVL